MDPIATLTSRLADRYAIEREIGRGGMATVYLARDVRHGRMVALKVLSPELGAILGGERFLSEIRVTASLQHPNLLPLFDSGEVDGLLYYVMPFVDGESLRDRLERERQLPVDEAIHIAVAVAGALEYAHRRGIIHRDLKPENILLQDGEPLVADFGIALAVSNAGGARITQTGLSLGTPQYMSPEQATGDRSLDARTDIYSLGAVTYEMLAGEAPHVGSSAQAIIARLMTEEPRPLSAVRKATPPHVEAAVECALEKLPADRFAHAKDFADALQGRGSLPSTTSSTGASARRRAQSPWFTAGALRAAAPLAVIALLLGALSVLAMWRPWRRDRDPSYAFVITLPDSAAVSTGQGTIGGNITISRDGRTIAYVAGPASGGDIHHGIWIRALDDLVARPVRGMERGIQPRFSPDGRSLMYFQNRSLFAIELGKSSAPVRVADSVTSSYDWIDGESVVFTRGYEFWITANRSPALWTKRIGEKSARRLVGRDPTRGLLGVSFPVVLPGAQRALVTIWTGDEKNPRRELAIVSLTDGSLTRLGVEGSNGHYARGHLVFVQEDGALYSAPFSLASGKLTGAIEKIVPRVVTRLTGWGDFDVSDNGTLIYVGGSEARRRLVLVDRHGTSTPVSTELRRFFFPRVSPDGRTIAVEVGSSDGFDIWTYDRESRTFGAMTTDHLSVRPGGWSSDGRSLAYIHLDAESRDWTAVVEGLDGSSPRRKLTAASLDIADVTVGGRLAVFRSWDGAVLASPLSAPTPRSLMPESAGTGLLRLSPDGRHLAYERHASGTVEIYAQSVDGGEARVQVSSGGGTEPAWSPKGDEIFYRGETHLIAARIAFNPLRVVRRDTLFRDTFMRAAVSTNYDVMPGGQQFLMVQSDNPDVYPTVLVNFIRPR